MDTTIKSLTHTWIPGSLGPLGFAHVVLMQLSHTEKGKESMRKELGPEKWVLEAQDLEDTCSQSWQRWWMLSFGEERSQWWLLGRKRPLIGFLSFSKIEMSKKRSPSWQNSTWKKWVWFLPVAPAQRQALAANEQSMGPGDYPVLAPMSVWRKLGDKVSQIGVAKLGSPRVLYWSLCSQYSLFQKWKFLCLVQRTLDRFLSKVIPFFTEKRRAAVCFAFLYYRHL